MKLFEMIFDEEKLGVYAISLVDKPAIDIDAIQFSDEQPSSFEFTDDIIESLLKIGKSPLKYDKNYRLMLVENIENDYEMNPLTFSSEDNKHFEIRYRYSGELNHNSRDFCRTMLSWNQEFSKDEIELFDDLNPQFAPKGKNSYSVFKFKGGVNCKHYWQRLIYWNQKESPLTYEEALKQMPRNLIKQIPKVDKKVSQIADASNNYWRLSFSSEKEQILTQPALIPNKKFYRKNLYGNPAQVFASAETIKKVSQNFFEKSYQNNSTIGHSGEFIKGVTIVESWIIENSENDKSNAIGFKELPKGTWMVSMKLSDEVWQEYVDTGQVKGLSIDAVFRFKEIDNQPIK